MPDPGALLRLGIFVGLWMLLALAEARWPRHRQRREAARRWTANFGLSLIDTLMLRLLLPWLAVDAAQWARVHEFGLLHAVVAPDWLRFAIAFVVLDLVIYWQHRALHAIGWLWPLHRVHHTDLALDASSGVRFHPLEILLSTGLKIAAVLALGAPVLAVLIFEIVLNGFALFTHANVALPEKLDRALRWLIVTPDMHRIHHSIRRDEHDRNFGFHVSWWDRLFGSYRAAAAEPQTTLTLGLDRFRDERGQRLRALLVQPFRRGVERQ
ncbi:MAG TPA: sterol desaturase family protein [Rhodanobacteraceae bacterium]|nr:sterol desaturase family protein [Rhodanobacteraceae bacterium]